MHTSETRLAEQLELFSSVFCIQIDVVKRCLFSLLSVLIIRHKKGIFIQPYPWLLFKVHWLHTMKSDNRTGVRRASYEITKTIHVIIHILKYNKLMQ